jgi:hypothetical protein
MLERAVTAAHHEGGQDGRSGVIFLSIPFGTEETKSLMASARQRAVGVIYPVLLWLTSLNSHPFNADRYFIGWAKAFGSFGKGFAGCALL